VVFTKVAMSKELVVTPQQSHILALSPVRSETPPQPAQATALPLRTQTHARSRRSPSTSKTWSTRTPTSCPGLRLEKVARASSQRQQGAATNRAKPVRYVGDPRCQTSGARTLVLEADQQAVQPRPRGPPAPPAPRTASHCTLAFRAHPHASGKPEFDILQIINFCFLGCVSLTMY